MTGFPKSLMSAMSAWHPGAAALQATDHGPLLSGHAPPLARDTSWDPYCHVLMLRFVVINVFAAGLMAVATAHGLVHMAVVADQTQLVAVICIVFVIGLVLCGQRIWQTSRDLNQVRLFAMGANNCAALLMEPGPDPRGHRIGALRLKLVHRAAVVRHIANSLVVLGLVGTVVGFIIALSGVNPEQAADVKSIAPMVSALIQGMSTALYTTLVGAVLNIWLMANHQLLTGGLVRLTAAYMEVADQHERL